MDIGRPQPLRRAQQEREQPDGDLRALLDGNLVALRLICAMLASEVGMWVAVGLSAAAFGQTVGVLGQDVGWNLMDIVGRPDDDPELLKLLAAAGLKPKPPGKTHKYLLPGDSKGSVAAGFFVHDGEVNSIYVYRGSGLLATNPWGLDWSMSREEVIAAVGPPLYPRNADHALWVLDQRLLSAMFHEGRLQATGMAAFSPRDIQVLLNASEAARPVVAVATAPPPLVVAPPPAAAAPTVAVATSRYPSLDTPLRTGRTADRESAVVIGLEDYAFIADVPHAQHDAHTFYDFLVYTRGVPGERAQLLTSGGREHLEAAVDRAANEAGPGGKVWVYFAGHGAADPATSERLLLGDDVRSDAIGFASRGLSLASIERRVAAAGAEPILVLDTCYSGVGRSGDALLAGTRFAVPSYVVAPAGAGVQWTAAGPNQLSAPLDEVSHGAFTYFALGALRGWADGELDGQRDGQVTAREAQAFVARSLRRAEKAEQQPAWWARRTGCWPRARPSRPLGEV